MQWHTFQMAHFLNGMMVDDLDVWDYIQRSLIALVTASMRPSESEKT